VFRKETRWALPPLEDTVDAATLQWPPLNDAHDGLSLPIEYYPSPFGATAL